MHPSLVPRLLYSASHVFLVSCTPRLMYSRVSHIALSLVSCILRLMYSVSHVFPRLMYSRVSSAGPVSTFRLCLGSCLDFKPRLAIEIRDSWRNRIYIERANIQYPVELLDQSENSIYSLMRFSLYPFDSLIIWVVHLVGRVLCLGALRSIFGYASRDVGAVHYAYGGCATGSTRHETI